MTAEHHLLVADGTFAVLGPAGDICGSPGSTPNGLFVRDARHLSRWRLLLDGTAPVVLVGAGNEGDAAAVLTTPGTRDEPPSCTIFRRQAVSEGQLTEELHLVSNVPHRVAMVISLETDADFADQFELRSDSRTYEKPGAVRSVRESTGGVEFGYRREDWHSTTTVGAVPAPALTPGPGPGRTLSWPVDLAGHGSAQIRLTVTARAAGAPEPPDADGPRLVARRMHLAAEEFTRGTPLPVSAGRPPGLAEACAQGLADLAGLLVPSVGPDEERLRVPGAGVPWFLTLFGRDSLITSFFALPYRPRLAHATLRALAATQATEYRPERIAQPGKIVHETRQGELAHFGQVPYGAYFGSVDSTPLFLVLLHAYTEQTGDPTLARRLERHARAAVDWMFRDGGLDAHGYLVYEADEEGLLNQNWKDSAGAVCFRDGTQATGAIAVSEAQGYAYDALRRCASLARTVWADEQLAARLDGAAAALRARFRTDFWMDDTAFPAFALDGGGRRVDALASDAGHLLWSGILDQDQARTVGLRLLEPDFFSGWGIRTLAADQPPYHPLSYHRGSIWPHDNAVTALGLARHGLREETETLARGLLDASARYGHRLPEVIAGYPREGAQGPVPYPHANSPQAWAAATPLALLTALATGRTES